MVGRARFEHAQLAVEDLEAALGFYTDVMGLTVVDKRGGNVYLGCGLDENFDLAVSEGGTGLDHFAIRIDEDDFAAHAERLAEYGVDVERTGGTEPNVERGLRFHLPMGASMELAVVADRRYHHSDVAKLAGRQGVTPLDADHVTFATPSIQENVEFLEDAVGFRVSEVLLDDDDEWRGAFTRYTTWHHDVAFIGDDPKGMEYNLRHIAWTMASIEHQKAFIDRMAQDGHQLEASIHRHYAGDNLAAYFVEPGGNRFELCAEIATLDEESPTDYTPYEVGYTAWGGMFPPDSYRQGSPPSLND